MHHHLIQDLAVILLVAGLTTVIFRRLGQPVVLGYILAGFIIGPHTPPFPLVSDPDTVQVLAELGVILLMFSLGLHFNLRRLAQVGAVAGIAALLEIAVMIAAGYALGRSFGWSPMDSLFLGAILSVSSTTIIIKALEDLKLTRERFSEVIFGILIVEDLAAVVILALLSGIAMTGGLSVIDTVETLSRLAMFLAVVLVAGYLVVPKVLRYVARFRSDEMLLVVLLGMCFGVALLAMKFGYSVALGAFLIGAIVSETREHARAATLVEPVRDMFSAVFFVAIGMLIEPPLLIEYAWPILAVTLLVVVGKVGACTIGALAGGADPRTSFKVGMGLAQIGEFSFIIASLGLTLGVASDFLYPLAVSVSAITTLLTPYLIRWADPLASRIAPFVPVWMRQLTDLYVKAKPMQQHEGTLHPEVRRMIRRSLLQVMLNVLLAAGIIVAASLLEARLAERGVVAPLPEWVGGYKTLLWLAAVMCVLPLLVAIFRKLQALCMIFADIVIKGDDLGDGKYALRSFVANVLLSLFAGVLCLSLLLISATLLPPAPVLVVLLLVIGVFVYRMWRHLVRVYARAQVSIRETLSEEESPSAETQVLTALPLEAITATLFVEEGGPAAGRLISELALRSRTGASIVAIEREGQSFINPAPHEELQPGDRLIVLGQATHLEAARALFAKPA